MKLDLTLFVPGLCAPWRGENPQTFLPAPQAPAAQYLLARADHGAQPALAFEDALARVFGVEAEGLPWGALGLWGETGARPERLVMRLDPVHLRLGMTDAVVAGGASLHLSLDEANTLARALEQHFSARGWRIVAATPERWYVCLDEPVNAFFELHTTPLSQALGHDAGVFKPQGRDAPRWLADLTEAQMLLFAHPVNAAREARGLPVINSLWPWGAGILLPSPPWGQRVRGEGVATQCPQQVSQPPLPSPKAPSPLTPLPLAGEGNGATPLGGRGLLPAQFAVVYANHPLARGLAHALELPVYDLAETFEECADLSGTALIVLDDLVQPFQDGDYDDWQATLEGLEARWFAPLRRALGQGGVSALQIDTGAAHFVCKPAQRWRFWRTVKPLESLCSAANV